MSSSPKLSPMAGYYVRRLMQLQKDSILQAASAASDELISEGISLEPEEILNQLQLTDSERLQRINNLEVLARAYQSLSTSGQHPEETKQIEGQIFATLGLVSTGSQAVPSIVDPPAEAQGTVIQALTVGRAVEILQSLLEQGGMYLGPKIASHYLALSRPENPSLDQLVLYEDHRIHTTSPKMELLDELSRELLRSWIQAYVKKCSGIIQGFHKMLDSGVLSHFSLSAQDFLD